ncbi:MAG TPA: pyridoxamine 5'-phosphate oxidase family protein [Chloroflexota bacterium]|nr:pyridoxamine 5'-phosphate oxidase family protein [Chloroflexota bacterium]
MAEPLVSRPYMPGYGIQTGERGLLTWAWAEQQLTTSHNFWLVTHWPDGRPHAMPVWAVWHDGALWFSSSKQSRKARNLMADPRCVLTTEDSANPVVVEGEAELLTLQSDLERLLQIENAKYETNYGMEMLNPDENSAFRVRPRWAFALQSDDFTGTPTRWTFEP